ncbi:MAG: hypothetical protein FJ398_12590 [Verrucomicrobia bacterium]|nr:hypothetical protein [Verrucomicrobiota bacterium]
MQTNALSPNGRRLASALRNGAVQLWTVSRGQKSPILERDLRPPASSAAQPLLTWAASGDYLAARLDNVYVWNGTTGELVGTLSFPSQPDPIALSPDGRLLAVGLVPEGSRAFGQMSSGTRPFNSRIELWDVASGTRISGWDAHKEWISDLAFSPDGQVLASANVDNTAKLWHVPTGTLKANLLGHTLGVFGVAFSSDSRTLATAGRDALKLWNVETSLELMTLERPGGDRVLFSEKDLALVFQGDVGFTIRRAPSFAEIEAAEAARAKDR